MTRVVALVPMRHDSERVPGKNYRSFNGIPLYHHILQTLSECSMISEIAIDTDSPVILEDAAKHFPAVRLIERPLHLRSGTISMNDVLLHDVTQVEADWYFQTHSTNPLLRSGTITDAIRTFLSKLPEYDSLFSVTRIQSRFWNARTQPVNHDPGMLLRTQDLPAIYEENSNMYLFKRDSLEKRYNRIGEKPLMYEIDRREAVDIDEELDFQITEFLYNHR